MSIYADFGLDTTKRGQDEPTSGSRLYCPWSDQNYSRGYSMCFDPFILSLPAALALLATQPEPPKAPEDACFKCSSKPDAVPGEQIKRLLVKSDGRPLYYAPATPSPSAARAANTRWLT